MSYFYLKPVEGNVQLHVLEKCVYQRFDYLKKLHRGERVDFCEYLLEGGIYDNIGHFLLGLLVRLSNHRPLSDFVNRSEEILFYNRLNKCEFNDARLLCKTILKSIDRNASNMQPLKDLCRKLIIKQVAQHVFAKDHLYRCDLHKLHVHFTHCLPFVAKRRVELCNGTAHIPCGIWKSFFKVLFNTHLNEKFQNIDQNDFLKTDPRWREIISKLIHSSQFSNNKNMIKSISHKDIDVESKYFPLCMKNLHNILRSKHRLSHDERFRYSLFLKDIGLPLQEAIYFWRHEYSKSANGGTCSHTWIKDEKKYIYGLRHLYGLEGARKNYSMSSCMRIQTRPSAEGGCAFKHFDDEYLRNLVSDGMFTDDFWNRILKKKQSGLCNDACMMYKKEVRLKCSRNNLNVDTSSSPVDYYLDLKKLTIN